MIPLVVIRPQPGCDATVRAARDCGLEAISFPMFAVRPLDWVAPNPGTVDALLIGSVNALRHGGIALEAYRGKPAYAVGQTSAAAARGAGLEVEATGEGGLQQLLGVLRPEHRTLLRLAGRDHVPLTLPSEVSITTRIVYASEAQPMPPALADVLRNPAIIALHSAEAARHLAQLCDSAGIARNQLIILALGPRIAQSAGAGWNQVAIAAAPNDNALLALAKDMCQGPLSANR